MTDIPEAYLAKAEAALHGLAFYSRPEYSSALARVASALMEAVETEREACALVADDVRGEGETAEEFDDGWNGAAMTIARAIRDRGGNNE